MRGKAEPAEEGGPLPGARGHSPNPSSSSRKDASTTLRFFWIKGC